MPVSKLMENGYLSATIVVTLILPCFVMAAVAMGDEVAEGLLIGAYQARRERVLKNQARGALFRCFCKVLLQRVEESLE